MQKVKTDGGQVDAILPQVDQEWTRSGKGPEGADGLAGGQPQGHQMRGGCRDRPQRQKRPVNKFVKTRQTRGGG